MAVAFAPVPAITVMVDRLSDTDTVTAADGTAAGITNAAGNSFKEGFGPLFLRVRFVMTCSVVSHRPEAALFLSLRASSPMMTPTNKGG
jgi:hypothetical protein